MQLYNPDQVVALRWTPGSWNKTESWEFDMPIETFRMPSASRLDRQQQQQQQQIPDLASPRTESGTPLLAANIITPKNTFRWKRDGRLGNKDMTCYLLGQTVGLHRSKEPDITIALFKHGRDPSVTIYEPNLQRVDVQDRKGLELVLLLGAQVIRDLFLTPRSDPFNMEGAAAAAAASGANGRRKNSRPTPPVPSSTPPAGQQHQRPMTVYFGNGGSSSGTTSAHAVSSGSVPSSSVYTPPSAAAIDAETKRLQAMLEREERERARRERDEQKRIKKMLEAEDKERRRREAEVAKETERLRKLYGTQGQDLPSAGAPPPPPPPASSLSSSYPRPIPPPPPSTASGPYYKPGQYYYQKQPLPRLPPRPVSAGPSNQPSWWHSSGDSHGGRKDSGGHGGSSFLSNPPASMSGFFSSSSSGGHRDRAASSGERVGMAGDERSRIQKKRSVHF